MRETLSRTQYSRIAKRGGWHFPSRQILLTLDTLSLRMLCRARKSNGAPPRAESLSEGTGMASVFLWNTPEKLRLDAEDESLKQQAQTLWSRISPNAAAKFFSSI